MKELRAITIKNCEVGTVSSLKDGSCKFSVYSPELRPSEAGALMSLHGVACEVALVPHEGDPQDALEISTEREVKSPTQRLYSVLYLVFKTNPEHQKVPFEVWRQQKMEAIIDHLKKQIRD